MASPLLKVCTLMAACMSTAYTAPPPPPPPQGAIFAGVITNGTVLQKGASTKAAVYGVVPNGATEKTTVKVFVTEVGVANYTIDAEILQRNLKGGNLTWKALLKPHPNQGGDLTISVACAMCANTTTTTVYDVTYGDVWFCSGQSNMELPANHALTRNRTFHAVDDLGYYQNIRTFKKGDHTKFPDGQEYYILPPPPPPDKNGQSFYGWQAKVNSSTIREFSAACWYFAQELTDIAITNNETVPILGMIQSAWGGTQIEAWTKNGTHEPCLNASGLPPPAEKNYGKGGIFNGMTAPFINMTIFGTLWYQGENNVYECIGQKGVGTNIYSCGNAINNTGYACQMRALVMSWRKLWSAVPGTSSSMFPFGIVSLAAGTSEGHDHVMPYFRHSQTGGYGFLPGPPGSGMESTFIAQGYDAGDPGNRADGFGPMSTVDYPYQTEYDMPYEGRVGYSAGGIQYFTPQFMGGLHPRAKQTIGRRLALAARAVAYNDSKVPFTGPVIKSCKVFGVNKRCAPGIESGCRVRNYGFVQRQISIDFDEELLRDDAVKIWPTNPDTEGLVMISMYNCINGTCLESCGANETCAHLCAVKKTSPCQMGLAAAPYGPSGNGGNPNTQNGNHFNFKTSNSISPLEVQLNHTLWMPAAISDNAGNGDNFPFDCKTNGRDPGKQCTNWTRVPGWKSMIANAPVAIPVGCQMNCRPGDLCENCTHTFTITGVRYAWSDSPCCGGNIRATRAVPCPPNSCPVSTYNSTLPAVPFYAKIIMDNETDTGEGKCECVFPQKCD